MKRRLAWGAVLAVAALFVSVDNANADHYRHHGRGYSNYGYSHGHNYRPSRSHYRSGHRSYYRPSYGFNYSRRGFGLSIGRGRAYHGYGHRGFYGRRGFHRYGFGY